MGNVLRSVFAILHLRLNSMDAFLCALCSFPRMLLMVYNVLSHVAECYNEFLHLNHITDFS